MKKPLKSLHQAHGKVEKFQPTTLDQLMGDTGRSKYRFLEDPFNVEEYETYLKSLVGTDLYNHAQEMGFVPTDNRKLLIDKLIYEFKLNRSQYKFPADANTKVESVKNLPKQVKDFLSRAK